MRLQHFKTPLFNQSAMTLKKQDILNSPQINVPETCWLRIPLATLTKMFIVLLMSAENVQYEL